MTTILVRQHIAALLCCASVLSCRTERDVRTVAWAKTAAQHTTETETLKQRYVALRDKVHAAKLIDPYSDSAQLHQKLELQLTELSEELARLQTVLAEGQSKVSSALTSKDTVALISAVDHADGDWQVEHDKIAANLRSAEGQLPELARLLNADAQSAEAMKPEIIARRLGTSVFDKIWFVADTAEFMIDKPATQSALATLVAVTEVCPELRMNITGHTAKTGDADENLKLSLARAQAVRGYLLKHGAKSTQIVKVMGVGGSQPLESEVEPGSAEERAADPLVLERVRTRNRRISVSVTRACK